MNTIEQARKLSAQRVRWLALGLVLGAGSAFGAILDPAFRRRVAAAGAAAAIAASSLLSAQPAAADTAYPVYVTFDNVQFTMVNDRPCNADLVFCLPYDYTLELYGTVGAYTSAGAVSAGGLPYRLFGKWASHPCEVSWGASYGTLCTKEVGEGTWDFTKVFLCAGSYYQTCSTNYSKSNNTIPLQVHPGEKFKVTVAMQDYDALSANDNACVGNLWFGPYTATELAAKKFVTDAQGKTIQSGFNGTAECFVHFHLS
jgi:hypothetical protein